MKGVVLAGGLGSRLYPLTFATNKHLLPIYDKPMVFYPIETLVRAGISEVMVVTGGPHAGDFIRVLKNGKELGLKHLEYAFQEHEGGIADALSLCEDFVDSDSLAVILGDNTTDADIHDAVQSFEEGAMVFLRKVPDPERFGVPVFDLHDSRRIVAIEEKPAQPKSQYAVTGLYLYDRHVFKHIKQLEPSARGELEITDVNNAYIETGLLRWTELNGFWSDAGTFESLFRTSAYWAQKVTGTACEDFASYIQEARQGTNSP
ncbi:MAG: spore coat protein [Chloroflexi bacterium RBG_13_56_8]|nr:MAG: spore coat protein [Chloroflexi bacterium RBG_13_56_8]